MCRAGVGCPYPVPAGSGLARNARSSGSKGEEGHIETVVLPLAAAGAAQGIAQQQQLRKIGDSQAGAAELWVAAGKTGDDTTIQAQYRLLVVRLHQMPALAHANGGYRNLRVAIAFESFHSPQANGAGLAVQYRGKFGAGYPALFPKTTNLLILRRWQLGRKQGRRYICGNTALVCHVEPAMCRVRHPAHGCAGCRTPEQGTDLLEFCLQTFQ
jgi:hypothetical protein